MNDDYIRIRIESELKKKIKEAAAADGRNMSNYIINLLKREVEKGGKK